MKNKGRSSHVTQLIRSVIFRNPKKSALLLVCMAASVLLALLPPQILRTIIDRNLTRGSMDGLFLLSVLYLLASVLGEVSEFGKGILLTTLGEKYVHRVRSEMMAKLSRISAFRFSTAGEGEMSGRFVNDVDNVGSLISDGVASLVTDLLKIAGIIVSIFLFSWSMAIPVIVLVPAVFLLTRLFQKLTLKAQLKNLEQMGEMNGILTDSISMAQAIKVYAREEWMQDRYHRMLEGNYKTNASINFFDASYSPLVQIVRAIVIALIAVLASGKPAFAAVSAGVAAASIDLVTRLFDPIASLGMEFQNIQRGISGIRRIEEFLDMPEEPERVRKLSREQMYGDVRFEDVSYAYEGGPEIIRDFSLTIKRGDRVTITGRTGAGKTTLIGLLTGLLAPEKGQVTIGGVNIREVSDSQKRQLFGYVQQDFVRVPGTVLDQVTMKDPGITEVMALQAVGTCGMIDEIQNLPDGLDTDMEKAPLSQGQKMLLQIARAIAPDPRILIFDESTASLDSVTEKRIEEALEKAAKDRIVLIISHRKTGKQATGKVIQLSPAAGPSQEAPALKKKVHSSRSNSKTALI